MNVPDALRGLLGILSQEPLVGRLFFASVEMAVLAGLLWLVIRVGRLRSPRLISVLWLVVLAKPLVALGVGTLLPVFEVEAPAMEVAAVAEGSGVPSPMPSNRTNGTDMSYESPPALPPGSAPSVQAAQAVPSPTPSPLPSPTPWRPDIGRWLTIAWSAGVILIALYTLIERFWLHRLIARSATAPDTVRAGYGQLAAQLGIRRPPRILVTDALESPALAGALAPAILVPSWLAEETGSPALNWALRHELMHWRLRDPIANAVRQLAQILLFFHPVTWWAGLKWEEAAELACDRALVQSESEAEDYAGQLYAMLARIHGRRQRTVMGGLFATRTQIGRRVAALLSNPFKTPARLGLFSLLCVVAVAVTSLCIGGAFATGEPTDQDEVALTPNRYEGPVELGTARNPFERTVPLALEGYAPDGQTLLSITEVTFLKSDDEVIARMKGMQVTWPKTFWSLHIDLFDDDGQTIAEAEEKAENRAFNYKGNPVYGPWARELSLSPWDEAQNATRFVMTLEPVGGEPAASDVKVIADGTVRNAAGEPVAGARVLLIPAGGTVHREAVAQPLSEREFQRNHGIGTPNLRTTQTNAAGRFSLYAPKPDYLLVVECPEGYCRVTSHDLSASNDLTLEPWARIEGTVVGPGGPVPDAKVVLSHPATGREPVGRNPHDTHKTVLYTTGLGTCTDETGRFVFERVPPGPTELRRVTSPSSGGGFTVPGTSVITETKPGQISAVVLGAPAANVEGKLVLPDSADFTIDWTKVHAELNVPRPEKEGPLLPGEDAFFADGMDTFLANDANRLYRRRVVPVNADGSFRIEGLPAGRFILMARVFSDATDEPWQWRLLATLRRTEIPVPLAEGEALTMNLGDIPLELEEKDYRTDQWTDVFRVGEPMAFQLKAGTPDHPDMFRAGRLTFAQNGSALTASLDFAALSGPKTTWRMTLSLLSRDRETDIVMARVRSAFAPFPRKTLASVSQEYTNSGRALGRAGWTRETIQLDCTGWDAIPDAKYFNLRVEPVGPAGAVTDPVEGAIQRLGSPDRVVRAQAAKMLGGLGDRRGVAPLIAALKDTVPSVRWSAARSLGQLKDQRAVAPLIAALDDEEVEVRRVVRALAQLGDARAVEPIAAMLDNQHEAVRTAAVEALACFREPATVDGILRAVNDSDSRVQYAAVRGLGKVNDPRALEVLSATFEQGDADLRRAAVYASGESSLKDAFDLPLTALDDEERKVREAAVRVVAGKDDRRVVPAMLRALSRPDEDDDIYRPALQALAHLGDESVVDAIRPFAGHEDRRVSRDATNALDDIRLGAYRAARDQSEADAVAIVRAALAGEDEGLRSAAIRFLGRVKGEPALALLLDLSSGPDAGLRAEAVSMLAAFDEPRATEAIAGRLDDPDEQVRWRAIHTLASRGDARAFEPLISIATDPNGGHRRSVASLLRTVPNAAAVDALCTFLNDVDRRVRREALESLSHLADPRSLDALIAAYEDPRFAEERHTIAHAWGRIGGPRAIKALERALTEEATRVAGIAAFELARLGWQPPNEELRVRYLVSSYQAGDDGVEVPRAEPSGTNRMEGPFVVDIPILTPLTVGTGDDPSVVRVSRVEFNVRDGELIATLHAGYSSWPDSWWLTRVDLLDSKGDVVGRADRECHASCAMVSGGVRYTVETPPIKLSFGEVDDLERVKRFALSVTQIVKPKPDTSQKAPLIPPVDGARPPGKTALWFDGTGDFAQAPSSDSLNLNSAFTIEAWIRFEEGGTWNPRIVSRGWEMNHGYEFSTNGTGPERTLGFDAHGVVKRVPSKGGLAAGAWYHVAAVYDGAGLMLYVNGDEVRTRGCMGSVTPSDFPLNIGRNSETRRDLYKGAIDEVRIWNVARDADTIRDRMGKRLKGKEPGLVAYWDFEEGEGQVITDRSGHGNDGWLGSTRDADDDDPVWIDPAKPYEPAEEEPDTYPLHVKVLDADDKPAGGLAVNPWKLSDEAPESAGPAEWPGAIFWRDPGKDRLWVNQFNTGMRDKKTLKLEPGTYRITVYSTGDGHRTNPTPFGVSEPVTIDGTKRKYSTEIRLQRGVPLSVRFVDSETRASVPYVELLLARDDGLPIGHGSGSFVLHTGQEGRTSFSELPPGTYWLRARKAAGRPYGVEYSLPDAPLRIDVADDEDKTLDIPLDPRFLTEEGVAERWPFVVSGTVTDETGNPVPDVEIRASCRFGNWGPMGEARSAADGAYTLRFSGAMRFIDRDTGKRHLGHEPISITAGKEGWYETNLSRQGGLTMADTKPGQDNAWGADPGKVILPNDPFRLDFVMAPAAQVKGRILDHKGRPVSNQRFTVCGKELPPSCSVLRNADTDEAGRFSLEIPCKSFWFDLGERWTAPINFAVPGEYELEITLGAKGKNIALKVTSIPPGMDPTNVLVPPETKPDIPEALLEQLERLSYVDETAEGKKSLAASGHAVRFERGKDARYVEAVQIYAGRYGLRRPPEEDFHLYLLNEQHQVLADLRYPYATIDRGDMRWYTLRTPSIEVPATFYAALAFNPHQTKGVFLGYDTSVETSHSFRGLPDSGYDQVDKGYDWMVRVWLAKEPTREKGVQHLADWQPPTHTDPFADCVEVKYDDGESGGMQSYGGAGPAIRFEVPEKTRSLSGLRVYGNRYGSGYDPKTATVKVTVLDPDASFLFEQLFPYALFSYREKWVDLVFDEPVPCGDAQQLTILIDPEAHQTKGVYFHYNEAPEISHSGVAKNGKVTKDLPGREWMIRAYFGVE